MKAGVVPIAQYRLGCVAVLLIGLVSTQSQAFEYAQEIELTPLPSGRGEAWLNRRANAMNEFYKSTWTSKEKLNYQSWLRIVRTSAGPQPTLLRALRSIHLELFKRFEYMPDYDTEEKPVDRWSMLPGFLENKFRFRGDCEDYALFLEQTLRHYLGVDSSFVLVGLSAFGPHAVLLVRNGETDYVVDSRSPDVIRGGVPMDFRPILAMGGQRAYSVKIRGRTRMTETRFSQGVLFRS